MPKPNYAIARLNKTFSFRLYLEGFDALPTPQTIPADSYYVTDRRLDGEVTIRYTDSPLVPNPAKRDSGLRYRLFPVCPDQGDTYSMPGVLYLAMLGCALDCPAGAPASAFRECTADSRWIIRTVSTNSFEDALCTVPYSLRFPKNCRGARSRWHVTHPQDECTAATVSSKAILAFREEVMDHFTHLGNERGALMRAIRAV